MEKLFRIKNGKVIAGVCNGLGEYFNIDPLIFRLMFLLGAFSAFPAIITYLLIWFLTPRKDF